MTIISISRGSYSEGREVAEKVAERLGYQCLSREVILEASERFNIPEIQLSKAIHDAPSILERLGHEKLSFVAYYQSVLTRGVRKDNIVYHGLAGHLLLPGVPHVLKIRIIADLADRVASTMKREGIPMHEAEMLIQKDDEERTKMDPKPLWGGSLGQLSVRPCVSYTALHARRCGGFHMPGRKSGAISNHAGLPAENGRSGPGQ